MAAAAELAYVPSGTGRALSTKSTRRVAVVYEELTNPYYPSLVEPIRQALAGAGYGTVLVAGGVGREPEAQDLADGTYDGVVLTTTHRRSTLPRDLTELDVPHVLVNRLLDLPESPSCGFDNRSGAREAALLVAGLGHTQVAIIGGPVATSTGRDRMEGARGGLARLRGQGTTGAACPVAL